VQSVDNIYSFEQAAEAHRRVETEKRLGTVVISNDVNSDSLAQAGVRGTPAIFINGRRLKERSLKGFQAAIDKESQKLGKKDAKPTY
jgi:protein-disulfide isomerase